MLRPRITVRGMLLAVAAAGVAVYAVREATTPVRPKYWVHATVVVHDRPIEPPLGNSLAPEEQREFHVRRMVSDEFLRAAVPERNPEEVRRRVRVGFEKPDRIWLHVETNSPEERDVVVRMVRAYVRSYDATVFHYPNPLAPLTYPRAAPVAKGAAGFAAFVILLAAGMRLRRRPRAGDP